ncbi:hypothetical protein DUNSADRAFT_8026, partial [Dunaliella salina]
HPHSNPYSRDGEPGLPEAHQQFCPSQHSGGRSRSAGLPPSEAAHVAFPHHCGSHSRSASMPPHTGAPGMCRGSLPLSSRPGSQPSCTSSPTSLPTRPSSSTTSGGEGGDETTVAGLVLGCGGSADPVHECLSNLVHSDPHGPLRSSLEHKGPQQGSAEEPPPNLHTPSHYPPPTSTTNYPLPLTPPGSHTPYHHRLSRLAGRLMPSGNLTGPGEPPPKSPSSQLPSLATHVCPHPPPPTPNQPWQPSNPEEPPVAATVGMPQLSVPHEPMAAAAGASQPWQHADSQQPASTAAGMPQPWQHADPQDPMAAAAGAPLPWQHADPHEPPMPTAAGMPQPWQHADSQDPMAAAAGVPQPWEQSPDLSLINLDLINAVQQDLQNLPERLALRAAQQRQQQQQQQQQQRLQPGRCHSHRNYSRSESTDCSTPEPARPGSRFALRRTRSCRLPTNPSDSQSRSMGRSGGEEGSGGGSSSCCDESDDDCDSGGLLGADAPPELLAAVQADLALLPARLLAAMQQWVAATHGGPAGPGAQPTPGFAHSPATAPTGMLSPGGAGGSVQGQLGRRPGEGGGSSNHSSHEFGGEQGGLAGGCAESWMDACLRGDWVQPGHPHGNQASTSSPHPHGHHHSQHHQQHEYAMMNALSTPHMPRPAPPPAPPAGHLLRRLEGRLLPSGSATPTGGCSPTGGSTPNTSSPLPSRSSTSHFQNQSSSTGLPAGGPTASGLQNRAQQPEKGGLGSEEDSNRSSHSQTQQLGHGIFGPSSCDASTPSAQRSRSEECVGSGGPAPTSWHDHPHTREHRSRRDPELQFQQFMQLVQQDLGCLSDRLGARLRAASSNFFSPARPSLNAMPTDTQADMQAHVQGDADRLAGFKRSSLGIPAVLGATTSSPSTAVAADAAGAAACPAAAVVSRNLVGRAPSGTQRHDKGEDGSHSSGSSSSNSSSSSSSEDEEDDEEEVGKEHRLSASSSDSDSSNARSLLRRMVCRQSKVDLTDTTDYDAGVGENGGERGGQSDTSDYDAGVGENGGERGGQSDVGSFSNGKKRPRQRQQKRGSRSSMFEACIWNDMHARTAAPPRKDGGGNTASRGGRRGQPLQRHYRPKLRRCKGGVLSDDDAQTALHAASQGGRHLNSSYPPLRRSRGGLLSDDEAQTAVHATSQGGRRLHSSYPPPQALRHCCERIAGGGHAPSTTTPQVHHDQHTAPLAPPPMCAPVPQRRTSSLYTPLTSFPTHYLLGPSPLRPSCVSAPQPTPATPAPCQAPSNGTHRAHPASAFHHPASFNP